MDFEFRCSECGELTSQEDNAERLKTLQKKISDLKTELEELLGKRKVRKKVARIKKKQVKLRKLEKKKKPATLPLREKPKQALKNWKKKK